MDNDKSNNTDVQKESFLTTFVKLFFKTLLLPPYYTLLFFGGVLVVVSVFSRSLQLFGGTIFLYAIAGVFWRHLTVDLRVLLGIKGKKPFRSITSWQNWVITIVYHIGNIALFLFLLKHLCVFTK